MRRARRSSTAHTGWSAISGRIRVVDYRQERRLIVRGAILSAYPLDGDWSAIEREYWWQGVAAVRDRKSTRLNSSHRTISYAVFCLKKKKRDYMCKTRRYRVAT